MYTHLHMEIFANSTLCKTEGSAVMILFASTMYYESTVTDVRLATAPDNNNVIGGGNTCIYVLICSDTRSGIIYNTLHVPLNGMQCNRSYGKTQYTLYNICILLLCGRSKTNLPNYLGQ